MIKFIVIDVDGTLTDSGIYYDETGNEFKRFSTRDAAGFFAAKEAGIKTIILTGRESAATARRMRDLKADYMFQNIKDKSAFLKEFMIENEISKDDIAYIGDDLNDLSAMSFAGFVGCPEDSCSEVKERADYISSIRGGYGAARDVIEYILKKTNMWDTVISKLYQL